MNLLETTRGLLAKRLAKSGSLKRIADESEGRVDYEWLVKFASGKVPNPTVTPVQDLYDFLRGSGGKKSSN